MKPMDRAESRDASTSALSAAESSGGGWRGVVGGGSEVGQVRGGA